MRSNADPLPVVTFPDGVRVPALGLGTWKMGEVAARAERESAALRHGLELGMTLIDTAEMYGEGGAERVVAVAIAGRRDQTFIVSKVYPHNATARGTIAACERSLQRLGTDHIDLYLLHWRGAVPLAETVGAFERLRRDGKIRRWGVSNFDVAAMQELVGVADGAACACNQVLYNLEARGIEWDLLPWCRERGIPLMAYSPLGQGALLRRRKLATIAVTQNLSPAQLALAFTLATPGVISIPQSSDLAHLRDNRVAASRALSAEVRAELDAAFAPPSGASALAML